MAQFRPMLAAAVDSADKLTFPLKGSPKLDGIRATGHDRTAMSRNMKPIPNRFVQAAFSLGYLDGLDGELMVGDPRDKAAFNNTTRGVMTIEGEPDFRYHVFDDFDHPDLGFSRRYERAASRVADVGGRTVLVPQWDIITLEDVELCEAEALARGYEGLMLRSPFSPYKYGRGTVRAQDLLKLKRFLDGEADVVGFEELMRNANEATTSALGLTARSTSKDGMYGGGTLGALVVRALNGPFQGGTFNIGSGFTSAQRDAIWAARASWLGRIVKYKWFPIGSKDAPRFPIFLGERDPGDM